MHELLFPMILSCLPMRCVHFNIKKVNIEPITKIKILDAQLPMESMI